MNKTKVKICGISNFDALKELIELNVDFIGFIFHQNSPRNVDDSFIKQILQINFKNSRPVCVFVNSEKDFINRSISYFKNPILQFHGEESESFCSSFNLDYWKVIRVKDESSFKDMNAYKSAQAILFENYEKGNYGGTGKSFDWNILNKIDITSNKIVLSGGINLQNVDNAINIDPWCLDLNSGVESEKGVKDFALIKKILNKII
jgi:phosphoribosylanthranilate isomerase